MQAQAWLSHCWMEALTGSSNHMVCRMQGGWQYSGFLVLLLWFQRNAKKSGIHCLTDGATAETLQWGQGSIGYRWHPMIEPPMEDKVNLELTSKAVRWGCLSSWHTCQKAHCLFGVWRLNVCFLWLSVCIWTSYSFLLFYFLWNGNVYTLPLSDSSILVTCFYFNGSQLEQVASSLRCNEGLDMIDTGANEDLGTRRDRIASCERNKWTLETREWRLCLGKLASRDSYAGGPVPSSGKARSGGTFKTQHRT